MTQAEKVDFTDVRWGSVEWTNLCTLYLRAYESRSPAPILGDAAAAEAVDRIEYDWARMRRAMRPGSNQYMVTMRAKQFDDWTGDFLRRYPNAVVRRRPHPPTQRVTLGGYCAWVRTISRSISVAVVA
jgi:O-methyltransferase involved in polyketide biosynthesis